MNLLPVILLPNVSVLERPTGPLYYYDLESKSDLARLIRFLLFTGAMSLSLHGETAAVFKAKDTFYQVKVETDTFGNNPFAVSFVTLYELESEYLDSLVDWSRAEVVSYKKVTGFSGLITVDGSRTECPDFTEYDFNDIWTSLTVGPLGFQHPIVENGKLNELLPSADDCLKWLEEKEAFKSVLEPLPVFQSILDKLPVEEWPHASLADGRF